MDILFNQRAMYVTLKNLYMALNSLLISGLKKLSSAFLRIGFKRSNENYSLFYKRCDANFTLLLVYVDDIVITRDDSHGILDLKNFLKSTFEVKDLGHLKYFLRMEVSYSKKGIFLCQWKYAIGLLKHIGFLGCRSSDIPIDISKKLSVNSGTCLPNPRLYQSLVELIYPTTTLPDLAYSVSQFMHLPHTEHLEAVKRILHYVKNAPRKGILFQNKGYLNIVGYLDADWANSIDDRRFAIGFCTFLGGNLIT